MELSTEGVQLLSRAAIIVVVILATAFVRTLVGPNPRRQRWMLLGTVGGLALGIGAANGVSAFAGSDVSALSSIAGVFIGWAIAYQFARRHPRSAQ